MLKIVTGDARDVARIMPIMQSAFDPQFGEAWNFEQCMSMLSLPYTNLWLAEVDGQLRGFAISRWILDEEELLMIGVDPAWQKHNIGRTIVSHLLDNAQNSGRLTIFLEVRDNNNALNFYKNLGFSKIGRRKDYYSGRNNTKYDAITMQLLLTPQIATGTQ